MTGDLRESLSSPGKRVRVLRKSQGSNKEGLSKNFCYNLNIQCNTIEHTEEIVCTAQAVMFVQRRHKLQDVLGTEGAWRQHSWLESAYCLD